MGIKDLDKELPNELLYEKGTQSSMFTLILSGKVTIFVGSENFRSDISSWSVLGAGALQKKEWVPDYSAFVSDGPCRCIRIERDSFIEASDASVFERRVNENKVGTALSATDSTDVDGSSVGESTRIVSSETSSIEGLASSRRKKILARLFHSERSCLVDPTTTSSKKEGKSEKLPVVQFAEQHPKSDDDEEEHKK